jgi:hypothetical protein
MPLRLMFCCEEVPPERVTDKEPLTEPEVVGAKLTAIEQVPPATSAVPQERPGSSLRVESPLSLAEMVAVTLPLLVMVITSLVEVVGTTTCPKSKGPVAAAVDEDGDERHPVRGAASSKTGRRRNRLL